MWLIRPARESDRETIEGLIVQGVAYNDKPGKYVAEAIGTPEPGDTVKEGELLYTGPLDNIVSTACDFAANADDTPYKDYFRLQLRPEDATEIDMAAIAAEGVQFEYV